MDPEAFVNLFDTCWFSFEILKKHSNNTSSSSSESSSETCQALQNQENSSSNTSVSNALSIHTDQLVNSSEGYSVSPDSVLFTPRPDTNTRSGKGNVSRSPDMQKYNGSRRRRTRTMKGSSKSMSELEFEELKGFMDLGFEFSEEDRNSSLVEIIPGLQRLGQGINGDHENDDSDAEEIKVARPYLSEAWDGLDDKKRVDNNPLMKWKFPAMSNENDMKDNLKWWAHSVASRVGA